MLRLSHKEAAILSLIAAHATDPDAKKDLLEILKNPTTTNIVKCIALDLLEIKATNNKEYKRISNRFKQANIANNKCMKILHSQLHCKGCRCEY